MMTTEISHSERQELFLMTKLQSPSSSNRPLVSRPRLLARVDQGLRGRLTLVCAPAGSGKTTLLTDWLQSRHGDAMPVAWLSLDERDNDPVRFWHYACLALEKIHETLREPLALLLQNSSHGSETMLIKLMNLLSESAPFVLVLDDYHLITAEPIQRALTFLLEYMPAPMHLVLLTRFEPSLPLARLRVQRQVMEIRKEDLRFTSEEVEHLFNAAMHFSLAPAHIQQLTERTEGWIAGLQLAALAMHDLPAGDAFISSLTGGSRYIIDYLHEEVIDHQAAEIQTFLLFTATLERMCASLCASVLSGHWQPGEQLPQGQGQDASLYCQEMLEHLERMNLFLVPLDHERHWYRYHHLFAEALLARLTLLHPSLIAELHIRASSWYEQQGLLTEAIEHALAARNGARACDLLAEATHSSLHSVSYQTLQHWMQTVTEEEIRSRPRLCFLFAWLLILHGSSRWETIEGWLEVGMQGVAHAQAIPAEMMGEATAMRAAGACFRGETERAVILAQQALQLLPAEHWQREVLLVILGSAFSLAGNVLAARPVLTRAIDAFRGKHPSSYLFAMAQCFLAEVLALQGRLDEAIQLFQEVIAERGKQPDNVVALAYAGLGSVLLERNELEAARSMLQQGADLYQKTGRTIRAATRIHIPLARVQYAQGEVYAAFATLAQVEHKARNTERLYALAAARRTHLLLQQGDVAAAVHWSEEQRLNPAEVFHQSSYVDPREFEYLMFVRVLLAQGCYDEANSLLKRLFEAADAAQRHASKIQIEILQALTEQARGASAHAIAILEHALGQARPQGYVRMFADEGMPMRTLLLRIHTKEPAMQSYVQTILAACQALTPAPGPLVKGAVESARPQPLLDPLSERELEALRLLAVGASNATIAQQLVIAPGTVKRHMSNIFSKLGVANRTQAAAQARSIGIL